MTPQQQRSERTSQSIYYKQMLHCRYGLRHGPVVWVSHSAVMGGSKNITSLVDLTREARWQNYGAFSRSPYRRHCRCHRAQEEER